MGRVGLFTGMGKLTKGVGKTTELKARVNSFLEVGLMKEK